LRGTSFVSLDRMKQTTLQTEVRCSGIGLHGGKRVELVVKPAPADTGVVFILDGQGSQRAIALDPKNVMATGLATTLGSNGARVSTVEHLLAALVGLEIDNVVIEVGGDEVPILDGSAAAFVYLFRSVGIRELGIPRRIAKIRRQLVFEHEGKRIVALPHTGLKIDYHISFAHPQIGQQRFVYESSPRQFIAEISRARTFGFMRDVEMLQKNGLALGGSLENAVVFDEYGVVNPEGLRFSDEMVRHKILDFMGDIAVSPYRLWGHFIVSCSGHDFNNRFMRFLCENAAEYLEVVDMATRIRSAPREVPAFGGVPAWA
jgi:UDP-3-O-[3-hydroxymyristoyl] N-acetylglucosamine deacetylase